MTEATKHISFKGQDIGPVWCLSCTLDSIKMCCTFHEEKNKFLLNFTLGYRPGENTMLIIELYRSFPGIGDRSTYLDLFLPHNDVT